MPLPNAIEAYEDIRVILDAVVKQGGGSYVLPSEQKAIEWRQRAYKFRRLAHKAGDNRYSSLMLRLKGSTVLFEHRTIEGQLLDPDGFPVDLADLLFNSPTEDVIE